MTDIDTYFKRTFADFVPTDPDDPDKTALERTMFEIDRLPPERAKAIYDGIRSRLFPSCDE